MKIRYVLDTHALVWSVLSPDRIGSHALRVIESAGPGELAITSATIMELGRLIAAGKIDLETRRPSDLFEEALTYNAVIPASLEGAIKAPVLGLPHSDPYDQSQRNKSRSNIDVSHRPERPRGPFPLS